MFLTIFANLYLSDPYFAGSVLEKYFKNDHLCDKYFLEGVARKMLFKFTVNKRREAAMQTLREKYGKTPVQKEISVVMKKAYYGFERLEKEHDEKIQALLEDIRNRRVGAQAA